MRKIVYIVIFFFTNSTGFGQDIHFSQYYSAPLTVNPAQTGLFDGNYRLGINYRNQWASVSVPYQTFSAFADGNLWKQPYNKGYLGIGLLMIRDQAGDGVLSNTKIFGSVAYHLLLNQAGTMQLSFGVQGGWVQESVDFSKLYFDNQWNDIAFDQSIPSGENYTTSSTHYMDLNVGVMYTFSLPDSWSSYLGASLYNLIQPRSTFYNEDNDLGLRPIFQGGVSVSMGKYVNLSPSGILMLQKNADEALLGVMGSYTANPYTQGDQKVYLGAYYRNADAAIVVAGYEFSHIRILLNYDINLSQLQPASSSRGAFEISLIYIGAITKAMEPIKMPCPRF